MLPSNCTTSNFILPPISFTNLTFLTLITSAHCFPLQRDNTLLPILFQPHTSAPLRTYEARSILFKPIHVYPSPGACFGCKCTNHRFVKQLAKVDRSHDRATFPEEASSQRSRTSNDLIPFVGPRPARQLCHSVNQQVYFRLTCAPASRCQILPGILGREATVDAAGTARKQMVAGPNKTA